ncbi:hypothetical protein D0Z67_29180 (plasmid) [Streptomyces seoulensis]|uniref:Uncharacterized protein n=1 Tax=Streptomyces seoulensis TaxID=73044 RepID=A0A4P6U5N0_STRSO|nr:hypothetical protein [Streptomyces seoulensis]QBJ94444.1 hypothetical protein D0Z67_29180 [Streptomyces seoulensis]
MSALPALLTPYTDDIATAAGTRPAASSAEFVTQLGHAADNLDQAGITGADSLNTAATLIAEAGDDTHNDHTALLQRAARHLNEVPYMVDEYRLMV